MLVFDMNILIYGQNEDSTFHYEFLPTTTHPAYSPLPLRAAEAWDFIDLLESPSFSILSPTERHQAALAQTIRENPDVRGNHVHDMHIVALMREHGVICTMDAGFRRASRS